MELLSTELRHIEVSHLTKLSSILDTSKDWDKLLEELCRPQVRNTRDLPRPILSLSLDSINLIRTQLERGRSPSFALLNHWAITGRRRPTLASILSLLRTCNLKWAEDYLCRSVLGIEPENRVLPKLALRQNSVIQERHDLETDFEFKNLSELLEGIDERVPHYSFASIYESTNHFCHEPYNAERNCGSRIGEGRFSSVFRAKTHKEVDKTNSSSIVAAKLLKSECNKRYLNNEINLMFKVNDENVLRLLGISYGSLYNPSVQYLCLIYDFIVNGSLLDCLSRGLVMQGGNFFNCQQRLVVAHKIAKGLTYLHTSPDGPIIHRDIKTANIFIDENLNPKIGDFTLVRLVDSAHATETQHSQNVIGTSVYMPPEAFRGDISIKFDTFSYGIVLLELLTGRKPFDSELDQDLFTFVSEKLSDIDDGSPSNALTDGQSLDGNRESARDKFLEEILDYRVEDWSFMRAKSLFNIALKATESRKKDRPEVSSLLPELETLL